MISIANQRATEWLEEANLRPTRQRLCLAEVLVGDGQDKHVTAETLFAKVKQTGYTVSLATVYNTIHAFKKKGYLKEISISSDKSYYDTNVTNHHHFFDENKKELIDLDDKDVGKINIKKVLPGKKINSIEVLVKIANNN